MGTVLHRDGPLP